jgi:hypothetical protein
MVSVRTASACGPQKRTASAFTASVPLSGRLSAPIAAAVQRCQEADAMAAKFSDVHTVNKYSGLFALNFFE